MPNAHILVTWQNWLQDPTTAFSAALMVFTVVLAIVGALQLHNSRLTTRRQLRAYLFVDGFGIGDGSTAAPPVDSKIGIPWSFIAIKNLGQTPAHDVIHWGKVDVRATSEEDQLIPPGKLAYASPALMGSGGVITKTIWMNRTLSSADISEIAIGSRGVYLYGRVEYRDIFGRLRKLTYRLRYHGPFPPAAVAGLTFCDKGNKAT